MEPNRLKEGIETRPDHELEAASPAPKPVTPEPITAPAATVVPQQIKSPDKETAPVIVPTQISDPAIDVGLRPTVDIKSDITRILKAIKLPERRGPVQEIPAVPHAAGLPGDMPQWVPTAKPKTEPGLTVPPKSPETLNTPAAHTEATGTGPGAAGAFPEPVILEEKEVLDANAPEKTTDGFFIPSLRTFREDVTTLMRTKKISMVQEVVMQQKAKEARETGVVEEAVKVKKIVRRKRSGLAFAVFTLVLLGTLALGAVVYIAAQRVPGQTFTTSTDSLMFAEQTFAVPIDDTQTDTLRKHFGNAREQATLTLGAVTRLVPSILNIEKVAESATVSQFFTAIGAKPPDILSRTFLGPFFLGIHTIDQNVPILVIPIQSYDRALEGMLTWEKSINLELSPLYTLVASDLTNASGTPEKNRFKDLVINNFDTRVLLDDKDEIRMLYAFPTRNLLIITERPNSFIETLARLRAERRL